MNVCARTVNRYWKHIKEYMAIFFCLHALQEVLMASSLWKCVFQCLRKDASAALSHCLVHMGQSIRESFRQAVIDLPICLSASLHCSHCWAQTLAHSVPVFNERTITHCSFLRAKEHHQKVPSFMPSRRCRAHSHTLTVMFQSCLMLQPKVLVRETRKLLPNEMVAEEHTWRWDHLHTCHLLPCKLNFFSFSLFKNIVL